MSDPAKYRTKEEVDGMKENRDPIANIRVKMLEEAGVKEDELKAIENEIKEIVTEAADFATESPELPPEELWTDVLKEVG
jgi:pyruvate dehydrogenase E1 component alpha subunit